MVASARWGWRSDIASRWPLAFASAFIPIKNTSHIVFDTRMFALLGPGRVYKFWFNGAAETKVLCNFTHLSCI
jgi:hypothetical protein